MANSILQRWRSDYPLLKPLEKSKNFRIYEAGADYNTNFVTFNQNPGINPNTTGIL